jgi:hypothetical protein
MMQGKRLVWALGLSCMLHAVLLTPTQLPIGVVIRPKQARLSVALQVARPIEQYHPEPRVAEESSAVLQQQLAPAAADSVVNPAQPDLPLTEPVGPPYPPPAPIYLPRGALDRPPRLITELVLDFPQLAGIAGTGRMVFTLLINESGNVDEVINESSSLGPDFIAATIAELGQVVFQPGMKSGYATKSQIRIEVDFSDSIYY